MTSSSPAKPILATNFIPLEPEEISAQWLFEVINQYRNLKELSLVSDADDLKQCEISEKKSSKGRFSSTYTIDVKFKCYTSMGMETCSMMFFLKLLPSAAIMSGERNRAATRKLKYFPKEVNVAFRVLPQIQKFAVSNGSDLKLAVPEIVYGSHDNKGNGVIVLTNEDGAGFASPKQYSGLGLSEVGEVIDRISEIHAASAAMLINKCDIPDPNETTANHETEVKETLREEVNLVFKTFAHFLRRVPGYLDACQIWEKFRPVLVEAAIQPLCSTSDNNPLKCFIHGDLYERNILFKYTPRSKTDSLLNHNNNNSSVNNRNGGRGGRQGSLDFADEDDEDDSISESDPKQRLKDSSRYDTQAVITDWKSATIGSPNTDLAFFFLASTSAAVRNKHTRDWLEQYYFNYGEVLRAKFGIKLGTVYPEFDFDVFVDDFESNLYRSYLLAIVCLTREVRFLENEFHYVKDNKEKIAIGEHLRGAGRRLLELADEITPRIGTKDWREKNAGFIKTARSLLTPATSVEEAATAGASGKSSSSDSNSGITESVSATIKLGGKT